MVSLLLPRAGWMGAFSGPWAGHLSAWASLNQYKDPGCHQGQNGACPPWGLFGDKDMKEVGGAGNKEA